MTHYHIQYCDPDLELVYGEAYVRLPDDTAAIRYAREHAHKFPDAAYAAVWGDRPVLPAIKLTP